VTNPATIGASANPTLQFDLPVVAFEAFDPTLENNGIVKQTLRVTAEYDVKGLGVHFQSGGKHPTDTLSCVIQCRLRRTRGCTRSQESEL